MDPGRGVLVALLMVYAAGARGSSAAPETPDAVTAPADQIAPAEGGLPALQLGEDLLPPFEPRTPESPADEQRRAARAWYMTGKLHEARGEGRPEEYERAAEAYRQAIELDPDALRNYEALIPLLYARDRKQEARDYALRAARQNERGLRIVRGLAAVMAGNESLQDAVGLLREAVALDGIDQRSASCLLAYRDLGLYLHMSQQPVEAAQAYRIVFEALQEGREPPLTAEQRAELLGDAGTTYDEFGRTFLEAKLPDLAVQAFDEAARHRTGRPGIHSFNLALVFRETGKPEEALAELEKYLEAQLQSKGRDAYQLLKDLLADLGRADELVPQLERQLERDPRNASLAYFLADEYVSRGEMEKGLALYEKTLGSSSDPRGLVGLMAVYRQQRKAPELVKVLGKLYPQMPEIEDPEDLQKLPPDVRNLVERYEQEVAALAADGEALEGLMAAGREMEGANPPTIQLAEAYMLGKLAVAAERTEDVKHFYRLTISMLNQPLFKVYREYGTYLTDHKEYAAAAEVFREGANHPAFQQARWVFLYFLSYALEFDGKTDEALQTIREARLSQPDNPQLHFQHAWIHYHAEQWDQAETLLKEIIEAYRHDSEQQELVRKSQFSLSNLYVQRGEKQRGEDVLQEVLKTAPDDPQANNDLGYLWADDNKNLEQARDMIEKALKAEPDNPAYLDSMGWVLYRLGHFDEARGYLEKAVQQPNGEDPTIFDHLGDVLEKLERRADALNAWRKAIELERAKARPDEDLLKRLEAKLAEPPTTERDTAAP